MPRVAPIAERAPAQSRSFLAAGVLFVSILVSGCSLSEDRLPTYGNEPDRRPVEPESRPVESEAELEWWKGWERWERSEKWEGWERSGLCLIFG